MQHWHETRAEVAKLLNEFGVSPRSPTVTSDITTAIELVKESFTRPARLNDWDCWRWVEDRLVDQVRQVHHELNRGRWDWGDTKFY